MYYYCFLFSICCPSACFRQGIVEIIENDFFLVWTWKIKGQCQHLQSIYILYFEGILCYMNNLKKKIPPWLRKYRGKYSKFIHFNYVAILALPKGLNLWPRGHTFSNLDRGLHEHNNAFKISFSPPAVDEGKIFSIFTILPYWTNGLKPRRHEI